MADTSDFTALLRQFMERALRSNSDLARLTGISVRTIEKWTAGEVRRPRFGMDVLKVAQALGLNKTDATILLSTAGFPPLDTLRAYAEQANDVTLLALLSSWPSAMPLAPGDPASTGTSAGGVSRPAMRYQLRAPITDFVGRSAAVTKLVTALRLATSTRAVAAISGVRGMGGIGKTELAFLVAHHLADTFPDAQIVLNLRGVSGTPLPPEQALQQVIRVFTPDAALPDDMAALQSHYQSVLHGRRALILADDARDAAQVRPLLPAPGCALLITSRQRFTLPGMTTVDLEQLTEAEAIALLRSTCDRLGAADAQRLARMCAYLPLALRISGSMLHNDPALAIADYLARLADERQRLGQLQDPEDPQLDVAASLTLSYAMLDAGAQRVFRQIGGLVADFATELALAVIEPPASVDVAAVLHRLLRWNLLLYDQTRARWRLHDLVRDLARRYLEAAGEHKPMMWRYAHAVVQIAQDIQTQYRTGEDGVLAALARFDTERSHIDAARRWATANAETLDGAALLLQEAFATLDIGELRYDKRHEYIPQLEQAHTAAQRLGNRQGQGPILAALGKAYTELGELRQAIPHYEQALTLARELGDQYNEGTALNRLGTVYRALGATRQAIPYYEQALTLARELGNRRGACGALGNLGNAYIDLGMLQQAISHYEQALILARELGNSTNEAKTLINLGIAYIERGEARQAITYCEQALSITRAMGDRRGEGLALGNLGNAYWALGEAQPACDYCARALEIARIDGDRRMEGYALSYLARAGASAGDLAASNAAFEAALVIFREVGDRWGEAECCWYAGLALARQGDRDRALPLLRAAVAYEQEIGHARATEHAALLDRLAAGASTPDGSGALGRAGDAGQR